MTDLLGKKMRDVTKGEQPYLTFSTEHGFFNGACTWYVLKTYQNDQVKQFARWLVKAVSPMTGPGGDFGDAYVYDVIVAPGSFLIAVDGRAPTEAEWAEVRGWQVNAVNSDVWQ